MSVVKPLDYYRETNKNRDAVISAAFHNGAYAMKGVGDFYGLHYSIVSRIVNGEQEETRSKT